MDRVYISLTKQKMYRWVLKLGTVEHMVSFVVLHHICELSGFLVPIFDSAPKFSPAYQGVRYVLEENHNSENIL